MRAHLLPILKHIRQKRGDEVFLHPGLLAVSLSEYLPADSIDEIELVVTLLSRGVVRRVLAEGPLSPEAFEAQDRRLMKRAEEGDAAAQSELGDVRAGPGRAAGPGAGFW